MIPSAIDAPIDFPRRALLDTAHDDLMEIVANWRARHGLTRDEAMYVLNKEMNHALSRVVAEEWTTP